MKLYPMNEAMAARCKEVMINYRYWMDEEGSDGMCCLLYTSEKMMRSEAADHDPVMPAGPVVLGALSALGLPWEYEYTYGSWFVDRSSFLSLIHI